MRLKEHDYTSAGGYFVTICTQGKNCLFGEVVKSEMLLNRYGRIVMESWKWLSEQYQQLDLDEWVIMPNHIHGIIVITDGSRGGSRTAPTGTTKQKPLGSFIGAFKTVSTKQINKLRKSPGKPVWQRNYFERVVRNENELTKIHEYIVNNPLQWDLDTENPEKKTTENSEKAPWQE